MDSPSSVDAKESEESYQGVSHQCNTASLWSAIEEGDLDVVLFQKVRILERGFPVRFHADCLLIVVYACEIDAVIAVNLDHVPLGSDE